MVTLNRIHKACLYCSPIAIVNVHLQLNFLDRVLWVVLHQLCGHFVTLRGLRLLLLVVLLITKPLGQLLLYLLGRSSSRGPIALLIILRGGNSRRSVGTTRVKGSTDVGKISGLAKSFHIEAELSGILLAACLINVWEAAIRHDILFVERNDNIPESFAIERGVALFHGDSLVS